MGTGTDSESSLPGCISEGDTIDEALENIKEAIELYLEPVEDELDIGILHALKIDASGVAPCELDAALHTPSEPLKFIPSNKVVV